MVLDITINSVLSLMVFLRETLYFVNTIIIYITLTSLEVMIKSPVSPTFKNIFHPLKVDFFFVFIKIYIFGAVYFTALRCR